MQAAGTAAKQINVIVCSHVCWQEVHLFGEKKVSCPWEGEKDSISTFQWHCITTLRIESMVAGQENCYLS